MRNADGTTTDDHYARANIVAGLYALRVKHTSSMGLTEIATSSMKTATSTQSPITYQMVPTPAQLTIALVQEWSQVGKEILGWWKVERKEG